MMRWFRNLNATPRLMISFGLLILVSLGMGYLGIGSLAKSNLGSQLMYQEDMLGSLRADQISIDRLDIAKRGRDAILHASEAAIIEENEQGVVADFASLRGNLAESRKLAQNAAAMEDLNAIDRALPEYEKLQGDSFAALKELRFPDAIAALAAGAPIGGAISGASEKYRQLNKDLAMARNSANQRSYEATRALMLGACALVLLLGPLLSVFIARGVSVPLRQVAAALEKVAGGDMTVSIHVRTQDEVGRIGHAFNDTVEKLRAIMREVAASASSVSASSHQLAAATDQLASGARDQAASLVQTSASIEKITATIRHSADNAKQASQVSTGSKDSAERGQQVVASAVSAMAEIDAASSRIFDIISSIDAIAFQTNLLAVNAAVEASRAGEHGRGFAVVAAEVRALAIRSAASAKEIKNLIRDSLQKVEKGTALVNLSGETLQGIVGSVKRVTDIVGEMAAAATEQSAGIEQVNTVMSQMDRVTQSSSAQTQELSSTARSLSGQAERLTELVSVLSLEYSGRDRRGSGPRDGAVHRGRDRRGGGDASMRRPQAGQAAGLGEARRGADLRGAAVSGADREERGRPAPVAGAAAHRRAGQPAPRSRLVAVSVGAAGDASFEEF